MEEKIKSILQEKVTEYEVDEKRLETDHIFNGYHPIFLNKKVWIAISVLLAVPLFLNWYPWFFICILAEVFILKMLLLQEGRKEGFLEAKEWWREQARREKSLEFFEFFQQEKSTESHVYSSLNDLHSFLLEEEDNKDVLEYLEKEMEKIEKKKS